MKKLFTITLLLALAAGAQAKIWRVNNTPGVSADFSDLQVAIDAASKGDTLYVEGSLVRYETATAAMRVTKKLVLMGSGYYHTDSTLYDKKPAEIGSGLYVEANGVTVEGLYLSGIYVQADSVVITRNLINNMCLAYNDGVTGIDIIAPIVSKNKIGSLYDDGRNKVTDGLIMNNICTQIYFTNDYSNFIITNNTVTKYSSLNTFGYNYLSIAARNSIIQNNICISAIYNGYTDAYTNWHDGNNSLSNNKSNLSNEFNSQFKGDIDLGLNVPDSLFLLVSNSVAVGAGLDGTDCGAFGGSDPYVLSGLPAIPHIYEITAPVTGSATGGLPVKIKVKTQN